MGFITEFILNENRIKKETVITVLEEKENNSSLIKIYRDVILKNDLIVYEDYKRNVESYYIDKDGVRRIFGTISNPYADFSFEIKGVTAVDSNIEYFREIKDNKYELKTENFSYKITI